MGKQHDFGNTEMEIKKVKDSIFNFGSDSDILVHEYGEDGKKNNLTHLAVVTRDDEPSLLGWKIIRMAVMGKSWRYIGRVTGIKKANISNLFRYNTVIRDAVSKLEEQIVRDARSLLVRGIRKATKNLIRISSGEAIESADKQKAQLEAIKELYNRVGFLVAVGRKGSGDGKVTIQLEGGESKALAVLIDRRGQKELGAGEDGSGKDEEEEVRETASGSNEHGSVASGSDIIEGEFEEQR